VAWLYTKQLTVNVDLHLIFRCLRGVAPRYLSNDIRRIADTNRQRLRSSSLALGLLTVRPMRLVTMGDRAFPVASSRLWNSLPHEVLFYYYYKSRVLEWHYHIKTVYHMKSPLPPHSLSSLAVLRHTFSSFRFLPTRLHLYSGLAVCQNIRPL